MESIYDNVLYRIFSILEKSVAVKTVFHRIVYGGRDRR